MARTKQTARIPVPPARRSRAPAPTSATSAAAAVPPPPPATPAAAPSAATPSKKKKKKRKKKFPKDIFHPKKPLSPYLCFSKKFAEDSSVPPKSSLAERSQAVTAAWHSLSAEERREFEEMADEDRVRYEREMDGYTRSPLHSVYQDRLMVFQLKSELEEARSQVRDRLADLKRQWEGEQGRMLSAAEFEARLLDGRERGLVSDEQWSELSLTRILARSKKKWGKPPKDRAAPKRAPSAFTLFCQTKRSELDDRCLSLSQLSSLWKRVSSEERQAWAQRRSEETQSYERRLRDYQASPEFRDHQRRVQHWRISKEALLSELRKMVSTECLIDCDLGGPRLLDAFAHDADAHSSHSDSDSESSSSSCSCSECRSSDCSSHSEMKSQSLEY